MQVPWRWVRGFFAVLLFLELVFTVPPLGSEAPYTVPARPEWGKTGLAALFPALSNTSSCAHKSQACPVSLSLFARNRRFQRWAPGVLQLHSAPEAEPGSHGV